MMYVFNSQLMLNLSEVLNVTQVAICQSYNGDPGTYVYRVKHNTFPLADLIQICNHFHIPISKFIMPDTDVPDKLPTRKELVYNGKYWTDISNMLGTFGIQFTKAKGINNKTAAELCGIAMSNFYNLFINKEQRWKKMLVKNFLHIFNNCKVYPGEYVNDYNVPIERIKEYSKLGYNNSVQDNAMMDNYYYMQIVAKNQKLQHQLESMKQQIAKMQTELNCKNAYYPMMAAEN